VGLWCCPQAALRRTVIFSAQSLGQFACSRDECWWGWCGSLPAYLERDGHSLAVLLERVSTENGVNAEGIGPKWTATQGGRGLDARGLCSRVVVVVAEVDRRRRIERSVHSSLHPIWRAYGDGDLARSQWANVKSVARRLRAKWTSRAGSRRKPITWSLLEIGSGSRGSAGVIYRWKSPLAALTGLLFNGGSRQAVSAALLSSRAWKRSERRREATGVSEVRLARKCVEENVTHQPGQPTEVDQASWNAWSPSLSAMGASPSAKGEAKASKRCWEPTRRGCS